MGSHGSLLWSLSRRPPSRVAFPPYPGLTCSRRVLRCRIGNPKVRPSTFLSLCYTSYSPKKVGTALSIGIPANLQTSNLDVPGRHQKDNGGQVPALAGRTSKPPYPLLTWIPLGVLPGWQ